MRTPGQELGAHRSEYDLHSDHGSVYQAHGLKQLPQLFKLPFPPVCGVMGIILVTTAVCTDRS